MSRVYCNSCHRPQVSCICHLFTATDNDIHVVVLQHPSEVKQAKGTATLLCNSLFSYRLLVGERFDEQQEFLDVLTKYQGKIALLYPSEQAKEIRYDNNVCGARAIECLIILDGTWKKAYRLYMMNQRLHQLPHVALPQGIESRYLIRSTKKIGALSSLEACCYALSLLEDNNEKYLALLSSFDKFNQMQLSLKSPIKAS